MARLIDLRAVTRAHKRPAGHRLIGRSKNIADAALELSTSFWAHIYGVALVRNMFILRLLKSNTPRNQLVRGERKTINHLSPYVLLSSSSIIIIIIIIWHCSKYGSTSLKSDNIFLRITTIFQLYESAIDYEDTETIYFRRFSKVYFRQLDLLETVTTTTQWLYFIVLRENRKTISDKNPTLRPCWIPGF